MKRKFNRNQKLVTSWDIQLSSLTSLGALFRDQSKTFDCLLTACTTWFTCCQIIRIWFCKTTKFILDYLVNHKQRSRILHCYGSWEQNFTRVPQASMLGSFLFSIDLCDLFFILNTSEIAKLCAQQYAGRNTMKTLESVILALKNISDAIYE